MSSLTMSIITGEQHDCHPMNPTILLVPHNDGTYTVRSFTMVGGYPLAYVTTDGSTLCPGCVAEDIRDGCWSPVGHVFVNWEDEGLYCSACSDPIESAYGPDRDRLIGGPE